MTSSQLLDGPRVLYTGYQPYFVDMAGLLQQELGWQPVYWIVSPAIEDEVCRFHPQAIRHGHYDAIKGVPAQALEDLPRPALCGDQLKEIAFHEAMALRMMERNDSNTDSFRHRDRVQFYYDGLRYWGAVLDDLRVDVVVFEEPPHQASNYILEVVARQRGVKTLSFFRTTLMDQRDSDSGLRMRFLPISSFEAGSELVRARYREALDQPRQREVALSPGIETYLSSLQGNFGEATAVHLFDQVVEAQELLGAAREPLPQRLQRRLARWLGRRAVDRWLTRVRLMLPGGFDNDQKQRRRSFLSSRMTYWEHLYYKLKAMRRKRRMLRYYQRVAVRQVELDQPFIFCPLHYQPEQSTSPLGDYYVDQLLMVELLSEALPEGWRLIVKDHVSQYVSSYARYGESFRTRAFFQRLTILENVELVSLQQDTFDLVDHSRAVATVTGTTGWEALNRGTPAIVFGHAWYRDCAGAFYTPSREALRQAIAEIEHGFTIDPHEVRLFAAAVDAESFAGKIGGPGSQQYYGVTRSENARVHADAAAHWWRSRE